MIQVLDGRSTHQDAHAISVRAAAWWVLGTNPTALNRRGRAHVSKIIEA